MSAHVLLNLLNKLGTEIKCTACRAFYPINSIIQENKCFVCFVALRPKSTAMVIAGRSVHHSHFFLGRLEQAVNQ